MRQLLVASLRSRGPCGVSSGGAQRRAAASFVSGVRRFSSSQAGAPFSSVLKALEGTQKAYYDLPGWIPVFVLFFFAALHASQPALDSRLPCCNRATGDTAALPYLEGPLTVFRGTPSANPCVTACIRIPECMHACMHSAYMYMRVYAYIYMCLCRLFFFNCVY